MENPKILIGRRIRHLRTIQQLTQGRNTGHPKVFKYLKHSAVAPGCDSANQIFLRVHYRKLLEPSPLYSTAAGRFKNRPLHISVLKAWNGRGPFPTNLLPRNGRGPFPTQPYSLSACFPISIPLHETFFGDVNRAAVAELHGLQISENIGNMIHDVEPGRGNFAPVEIGVDLAFLFDLCRRQKRLIE